MIEAYRICQRRLAKTAFSGEGARLYGGRWNNPGTRLIYLAGSVALAQLEVLVHLESDEILHEKYVVIPVKIRPRDISILPPEQLPRNWRAMRAPVSTRKLGDDWTRSNDSLVLRVPSVVVPQEWNYLINPAHPNFSKLETGKPQALTFDSRLS
jgi:RES domain-containing protein